MRIAFITPEFVSEPYFSGGLANYLHRLTQVLASIGHDVHVITRSHINGDEFVKNGVCVHRVKIKPISVWYKLFTLKQLSRTGDSLKFSYFTYLKLKQLHREKSFDLIQSSNFHACGLFTLLFLRIPHVTRISSYRPLWNHMLGVEKNLDTKMIERLEKFHLRLCKHIYAPSFTLQRILEEKASIRGVKVIRTPFFIENDKYDFSIYELNLKGKDYLLFFGRLDKHKGPHILGQALPEVFSRFPDIHAVFVGLDSPSPSGHSMREYIKQQCKNYSQRLFFFDALAHKQLYPIIKSSRFVVLPSSIDNLPNAMLEAMALGKSVLGTINCSFDEIIEDGKNGFLTEPNNPSALAQKIIEICQRQDLDKIGAKAAEKMREFLPDNLIPKIVNYYQEVIDTTRKRNLKKIIF